MTARLVPRPAPAAALALLGLAAACVTGEGPRDERLRSDVAWLADSGRGGRRAGTPGERATAEWIAARLAWLQLEPAGEEGYFQRFPVPLPARDGGGSFLVVREPGEEGAEPLRRVERGEPLWFSSGGRAAGPVAFRGFGLHDPQRGWLDHGPVGAGALPEGAIVLVVEGLPAALAASAAPPRVAALDKAVEAHRRGAAAFLLAPHPTRAPAGLAPFEPNLAADAGLPALRVDLETARALVPDYDQRVAALDRQDTHAAPPPLGLVEVEVSADVHRDTALAANVLGRLRGRGGPAVVVCAHHDHLGYGGGGELERATPGAYFPGADDDASGVAVVLEVARALARRPERPAGDVLFAFFSGNELGHAGSARWCQDPTLPLSRIGMCVDVDTVGRAGDGDLEVLGVGTSPPFAGWLAELAGHATLDLAPSRSTRGLGGGDHQAFLERGIPTLQLTSGPAPEHHRPGDGPALFEAEGAAKVATMVLDLVRLAQSADGLDYTAPPPPPRAGEQGFPVRFGAVRALDHEGLGLALAGVTPDSPAERAGLLPGDVLVGAGGMPIDAMVDFLDFLQRHRPADAVRVRFVRDGAPRETLVVLEARDPDEAGAPAAQPPGPASASPSAAPTSSGP